MSKPSGHKKPKRQQSGQLASGHQPVHSSKTQTIEIQEQRFQISQGPLPDPDTLAKYESMLPGLAQQITDSFREQQVHRQSLERELAEHQRIVNERILEATIENKRQENEDCRRGQQYALVICLVFAGCGTYAILQGHSWAGAVVGTGGLVSIVGMFLHQRASKDSPEKEAEADAQE